MVNEKTRNEPPINTIKIRRKIKKQTIIGIVLVILQTFAYLGSFNSQPEVIEDTAELMGHYTGYNLFLIIAVILFINVYFLKNKLKLQEQQDMIDLIGHPE